MKQYKLIQVALLAILLFGWAGCSQNEEKFREMYGMGLY